MRVIADYRVSPEFSGSKILVCPSDRFSPLGASRPPERLYSRCSPAVPLFGGASPVASIPAGPACAAAGIAQATSGSTLEIPHRRNTNDPDRNNIGPRRSIGRRRTASQSSSRVVSCGPTARRPRRARCPQDWLHCGAGGRLYPSTPLPRVPRITCVGQIFVPWKTYRISPRAV